MYINAKKKNERTDHHLILLEHCSQSALLVTKHYKLCQTDNSIKWYPLLWHTFTV